MMRALTSYRTTDVEFLLNVGASCYSGVSPLFSVESLDDAEAVYSMLDRGANLWEWQWEEDEDADDELPSPLGDEFLPEELAHLFLGHSVFVSHGEILL